MDDTASARILARLPLLAAGLRRLASGAQVNVIDSDGASLVLRSPDQAPDGSPVDVTVVGESVIVTCRATPSTVEWEAVRRVIDVALGP